MWKHCARLVVDGVISAANVVSRDLIPEVVDREGSGMPWCSCYI